MKTRVKKETSTTAPTQPPRPRRGKKPPAVKALRDRPVTQGARFVEVPQPKMFVLKHVERVTEVLASPEQVKGAYVKVSPTIRASERAGFDSRAIREELLAAGAVAVVIAPVVVPDEHKKGDEIPSRVTMTAEQHLRAWFDSVKLAQALKTRALEEALASAREAGL